MPIMLPKTTQQILHQSTSKPKLIIWAISTFCAGSILYSLAVLGRQTGGVSHYPSLSLSAFKPWAFDLARDEKDYSLTEAQCNSAFPGLFRPILETLRMQERPMVQDDTVSVAHWVEGRAMLYNNEVLYPHLRQC